MSLYFRKSKPLPLAFLEKCDTFHFTKYSGDEPVTKQLINEGVNTKKLF